MGTSLSGVPKGIQGNREDSAKSPPRDPHPPARHTGDAYSREQPDNSHAHGCCAAQWGHVEPHVQEAVNGLLPSAQTSHILARATGSWGGVALQAECASFPFAKRGGSCRLKAPRGKPRLPPQALPQSERGRRAWKDNSFNSFLSPWGCMKFGKSQCWDKVISSEGARTCSSGRGCSYPRPEFCLWSRAPYSLSCSCSALMRG